MNKLQKSIFSKIRIYTKRVLYFKLNEFVTINMKDSSVYLKENGRVYTNTYFNSISLGKWKEYTCVENLNFNMRDIKNKNILVITHRLYLWYENIERRMFR